VHNVEDHSIDAGILRMVGVPWCSTRVLFASVKLSMAGLVCPNGRNFAAGSPATLAAPRELTDLAGGRYCEFLAAGLGGRPPTVRPGRWRPLSSCMVISCQVALWQTVSGRAKACESHSVHSEQAISFRLGMCLPFVVVNEDRFLGLPIAWKLFGEAREKHLSSPPPIN